MLDPLMLKALLVVISAVAILGAKYGLGWKDRNPIEVVAKEVIKAETGIDLKEKKEHHHHHHDKK